MKNILKSTILIGSFILSANFALADGMLFEPINVNQGYSNPPASTIDTSYKANVVENTSVENSSLQNAILQVDNAQVEIRNELLKQKAKYSDVDQQYKLIRDERKMLSKQVRATEKRIKDLDKTKEKIRKNIN